MRILFDVGVPRLLARWLKPHTVVESRSLDWDRISKGKLLRLAENNDFDLLITNDTNMSYQQSLKGRRIAVLVLTNSQWPMVRLVTGEISAAVETTEPVSFAQIRVPLAPKRRNASN